MPELQYILYPSFSNDLSTQKSSISLSFRGLPRQCAHWLAMTVLFCISQIPFCQQMFRPRR